MARHSVGSKEEKNESEVLLGATELKNFSLWFCWNAYNRQEEKTWPGPPFESRKKDISEKNKGKIDKKLNFLSQVR